MTKADKPRWRAAHLRYVQEIIDARERQLISLLGPECFYDHERLVKPTRRPELGPPVH